MLKILLTLLVLHASARQELHDWHIQSEAEIISADGHAISRNEFDTKDWYTTNVPGNGTILATLEKNGVYTDLYAVDNLKRVNESQFDPAWWYRTQFTALDVDEDGGVGLLTFKGINYKADVWLNGQQLANSTEVVGTFRIFDFDISGKLLKGQNTVALRILRPSKNNDMPYIKPDTDLAFTFVDWAPNPPDGNAGIWREATIELFHKTTPVIRYPVVNTQLGMEGSETYANLTVAVELTNVGKGISGTLVARVANFGYCKSPVNSVFSSESTTVEWDVLSCEALFVKNPQLWWPHTMGDQFMYDIEFSFYPNAEEKSIYTLQSKFGIREVTSFVFETRKDKFARQFLINGKKIMVKGGGYTPDLLQRRSVEKYEIEFAYMKDMGLNAVRLEGKMEVEDFYRIADQTGIIVMVGWCCCGSWQQWDDWTPETQKIANQSLLSQLKMQRIHPSMFLWAEGSDEAPPEHVDANFQEIFKQAMWTTPVIISTANDISKYTGHSGVKMEGPYAWVPPTYWLSQPPLTTHNDSYTSNFQWYGVADGYATEISPGAVPMSKQSQLKIIPEDKLWPINELQIYHTGQIGDGGNFHTLDHFNIPLYARYGKATDLYDYLRKSDVAVYEAHRAMFEAYNLNRYTNSTGIIQWMLNNPWPSMIWHLFDYFHEPAPSYFATKKANEEIHIQYAYNDSSIYAVNNGYSDHKGLSAFVEVISLDGKQLFNQTDPNFDLPADSVLYLSVDFTSALPANGLNYFLLLTIQKEDGKKIDNVYWLSPKMDELDWSATNFYQTNCSYFADMTALQSMQNTQVSVHSHHTAEAQLDNLKEQRAVMISNADLGLLAVQVKLRLTSNGEDVLPVIWSENYFTLRSGESRMITYEYHVRHGQGDDLKVEATCFNCEESNVIFKL